MRSNRNIWAPHPTLTTTGGKVLGPQVAGDKEPREEVWPLKDQQKGTGWVDPRIGSIAHFACQGAPPDPPP